jgi:hypothetical protein
LASNADVWNAPFDVTFNGPNRQATTWTPTTSEDDDSDLLGLGTTSDADYGF